MQTSGLAQAVGAAAAVLLASMCRGDVHINEIQSSNSTTIQDDFGDASDWIELFNDGTTAVNLAGWGLSDEPSNPFKSTLKAVFIQPGQCLIVWASGRDGGGLQQHVGFKISASGEQIVLTQPDGTRADAFPAAVIPRDRSMGRFPDGVGAIGFFAKPTPRARNSDPAVSTTLLPAPTFSVAGGAHAGPVTVGITSSVSGGTIRYTLDGSEPTESSAIYSGPITLSGLQDQPNVHSMVPTNLLAVGAPLFEGWEPPLGQVSKLHVLRAGVFKANALPGRVATQSYLVDPLGAMRYPFPVVSLSTAPMNLFDAAIGIYVKGNARLGNYFQEGAAWERAGHLEFYEQGGRLAFQGEVGIRIHGNTTSNRPRKALRIYARPPYGSATFNYRIFPEKPVSRFETFLLRNSGNDWGQAIMRDSFVSAIAASTDIDRMSTRPAVVFVDGEYWGLHDVRDRIDEGYFLYHHGLGEADFTELEVASSSPQYSVPVVANGDASMLADYQDLLERAKRGEYATTAGFDALAERIDVDNLIDYLVIELWCGNTDWPGNNMRLWRKVVPDRSVGANPRWDGRWRWILFDTDFGLALNLPYVTGSDADPVAAAGFDSLKHATDGTIGLDGTPHWATNEIGTRLIRKCLENPVFRERFAQRACDLLSTRLSSGQAVAQLDAMQASYAPGMAEHALRWRQPADWTAEVARMRAYLQARPAAMVGHLATKFGLPGGAALVVQVSDQAEGVVQVNSIVLDAGTPGVDAAPYPWTGTYLRGVPVRMQALPRTGHRFVRWIDSAGPLGVDPSAPDATLVLDGPRTLRAEFEPIRCPADLDASGGVDFGDAALLQMDFGPCAGCASDLDADGKVDFADIAILLLEFGPCP